MVWGKKFLVYSISEQTIFSSNSLSRLWNSVVGNSLPYIKGKGGREVGKNLLYGGNFLLAQPGVGR